jgi:hypothetical protein
MSELSVVAPAFIEKAHEIVWATVATVDQKGRPRSRVLHPFWAWDGAAMVGWIATSPTAAKRAHLDHSPYVSVNYWAPNQDTLTAECAASWAFDDETRIQVWDTFKHAPAPVGYDPAIVPGWGSPTSDNFAALRLEPWRLRVFPGGVLLGTADPGTILTWAG